MLFLKFSEIASISLMGFALLLGSQSPLRVTAPLQSPVKGQAGSGASHVMHVHVTLGAGCSRAGFSGHRASSRGTEQEACPRSSQGRAQGSSESWPRPAFAANPSLFGSCFTRRAGVLVQKAFSSRGPAVWQDQRAENSNANPHGNLAGGLVGRGGLSAGSAQR